MTNDEAICILENAPWFRWAGQATVISKEVERVREAMQMAVEALKQANNSNMSNTPNTPNTLKSLDCVDRQAAIDTEGLDEQIRCEMCRNPMHTNRGCDGNCKYDEKLYERIMQILGERIKPLPSVQPEPCSDAISRQGAIDYCYQLINVEHLQGSDEMNYGQERVNQTETILHHLEFMPSVQPERLTDDDFETIRIHLSALKERLCNQHRWKEAEDYQRLIDRFMSFAERPEIMSDGTLHITVNADVANIDRILLSQAGTHLGDLYYRDDERPEPYQEEGASE